MDNIRCILQSASKQTIINKKERCRHLHQQKKETTQPAHFLIEVDLMPLAFRHSFSNLTSSLSARWRALWSLSCAKRSTRTLRTRSSNWLWLMLSSSTGSAMPCAISSLYSAISHTSFLRIHCFSVLPSAAIASLLAVFGSFFLSFDAPPLPFFSFLIA